MLGDLLDQIAIDHDGIDWWVTDSSLHMDLVPPITAVPNLSKFDQMAGLLITARWEHEIDTSDIPEWTEEMWKRRAWETLPPTKTGGEPAAGCRWDRVAEEGWRGDTGKPDAAGADAGGVCGRGEECGSSIVRMPTHRISQRRDEWGTLMWVPQQQPWQTIICPITRRLVSSIVSPPTDFSHNTIGEYITS